MTHRGHQREFQAMLDAGYHCSQCVFAHWARQMNIQDEFALRLASGLGMGVNHGDSCGAITSTVLALGLVRGFSQGSQSGADGGIEHIVEEFESAFIERNGSLLCRDLLSGGYDAANPDAKVQDDVNPWENCAKYCADAVELAEPYLAPGSLAARPLAEEPQEGPSPIVIGAGSAAAGLVLGAGTMAVVAYERRRAQNERREETR